MNVSIHRRNFAEHKKAETKMLQKYFARYNFLILRNKKVILSDVK